MRGLHHHVALQAMKNIKLLDCVIEHGFILFTTTKNLGNSQLDAMMCFNIFFIACDMIRRLKLILLEKNLHSPATTYVL